MAHPYPIRARFQKAPSAAAWRAPMRMPRVAWLAGGRAGRAGAVGFRAALIGFGAALGLAVAAPAAAAPVLPSLDGCATELPNNRATWTSTRHFQFVAFWDPVAGCDPTIYQPIILHQCFENFDGTGGLKVETLFELFPKCGRIQFDAHAYISATSDILDDMGLVSLVFNTGVDCVPGILTPEFLPPMVSAPTVAPIPESASLLLFGTGLVLLKWYARKERRV